MECATTLNGSYLATGTLELRDPDGKVLPPIPMSSTSRIMSLTLTSGTTFGFRAASAKAGHSAPDGGLIPATRARSA